MEPNEERLERASRLVARRLYAIKQAGVINPMWLVGKVKRHAVRMLKSGRENTFARPRGLVQRAIRSLSWPWGRGHDVELQAEKFSRQFLELITEQRVTSEKTFQQNFKRLIDNTAKLRAVHSALYEVGLDRTDLPFDTLDDASFSDLFSACSYRFAYGQFVELEPENIWKTTDNEGLYLTYLKDADSGLIERRLIGFALDYSTRAIDVVELSRENGKLIVRAGVVAPNAGADAFLLSSAVDPEVCRDWLSNLGGADEQPFANSEVRADVRSLQFHRLVYMSLRPRTPGELFGAFVDGERFGQITGRVLDEDLTAETVAGLGRLGEPEVQGLSVDDRNLIAAMPRLAENKLDRSASKFSISEPGESFDAGSQL